MKKIIFSYLFIALILPLSHLIAQSSLPRVYLMDADRLVSVQQAYQAKRQIEKESIQAVISEAVDLLKFQPVSVMQKSQAGPSGDKHDYVSVSPYWWPDSSKPDGLPYIRRDGVINPDRYTLGDRERIGAMVNAVSTLSLAYYITLEERFASHAAQILKTWFLEPKTKMNPHLEYSQIVRGLNLGRGTGIIDSYGFRNVVDAIGLLNGSRHWTTDDQRGIEKWFAQYLDWLLNSKNGKEEAEAENNHGTTYAVQVATIALFLDRSDIAQEYVQEGKERIAAQIEPNGSQPLELVRTKSWNYSMLNLEALIQLALLGEVVGIDLWHYQTSDGRCIRKAIEFLIPSATRKAEWKEQQITRMESERLCAVLQLAAVKYRYPEYESIRRLIPNTKWLADRSNIIYPKLSQ
ncbi:MAG: alginate lyase family protein [bacterium]